VKQIAHEHLRQFGYPQATAAERLGSCKGNAARKIAVPGKLGRNRTLAQAFTVVLRKGTNWAHGQTMPTSADTEALIAERARASAPIVWLVGKVQSGKTSIVRELTQASDPEIGTGFRACTKTARVFDFPAEAPIIRFLDTRGLGEVAYDASEDIAFCEGRSHLILPVMKALDLEQGMVLDVVRAARLRHPDWPVVVAQTSLHEAYGAGQGHIVPYPFAQGVGHGLLPERLVRALEYQRSLFVSLPGRSPPSFVPIDFTQATDALQPADYGRDVLVDALIAAAPAAVAVALTELLRSEDGALRQSSAHVLGFALAAGASDALPVAGIVTVPMMQAAMLHHLAKRHGVRWDKQAYTEFGAALGAGTLLRAASTFAVRQLGKLIPVYGQSVGAATAAAASFATTYAMGKAASYFLLRRRRGREAEQVASVYRSALKEAFALAKERPVGSGAAGASA
jgi:uncharacterized protein (DUF697 family)